MKLIRNKLALTPSPDNRLVLIVGLQTQRALILDKLLEEAHEVWSADSRESVVEELGDLMEAFYQLLKLHDISMDEVVKARLYKKETRGSFDGGYVLL